MRRSGRVTLVARALAGVAAATLGLLAARPLAAQGALSTQGFGYPTGQLSTRALGAGGGLGEFDVISATNPAAIAQFLRPTFGVQYDPEFRSVTTAGRSQGTTTSRFPVITAGTPAFKGFRVGVSATTLLDRSFTTQYRTTTQLGDGPVTATDRVESRGAIADVRFGLARFVGRRASVGLAGHVYTGENRVVTGRVFDDTSRFGPVADSSVIGFRGTAMSGGVDVALLRGVNVAASYRRGFGIRTERNDSTLTEADVPNRVGVGLRVDRVAGATFGVSWARTSWSRLQPLGSASLRARDADELRAGVEAIGPRLGDLPILLRLGAFQRDLPFGVSGRTDANVRETGFTGGAGLPLGGGRAVIDLAAQRAQHALRGSGASALGGVSERAWTVSVGITVRP